MESTRRVSAPSARVVRHPQQEIGESGLRKLLVDGRHDIEAADQSNCHSDPAAVGTEH
jgi:hypothetical protein